MVEPKKLAKWRNYHKRAKKNELATIQEMSRLPRGHDQTICYHLGVIYELAKDKDVLDKEAIEEIIYHLRIAVIHSKSLNARVQQHKLGIR